MMFATLTGFRFCDDRTARFRWGEVSRGWGLALALINWSNDQDWSLNIKLIYGQFFIKLPFLPRREPACDMLDKWGFSWAWSGDDHMCAHFNWGAHSKIVYMPWSWERHSWERLREDGSWVPFNTSMAAYDESLKAAGGRHDPLLWVRTYPYTYRLRSGEVQERIATVTVERSELRWRALKRLPFPRKRSTGIDVRFSDEVGERAGSWKGGCIGCGWTVERGETPEQALRRMERVRKF